MQGLRRVVVALAASAALAGMTGCTGLGVNFGSGAKGGTNVTTVGIQTVTGINVLQVNVNHCLVVQAVATTSGTPNGVSSVQGAVWTKAATATGNINDIGLFEADCIHPYAGESQQAIGIIGTPPPCPSDSIGRSPLAAVCIPPFMPGDGTAFIKATVQGVTGVNTVKVFFV